MVVVTRDGCGAGGVGVGSGFTIGSGSGVGSGVTSGGVSSGFGSGFVVTGFSSAGGVSGGVVVSGVVSTGAAGGFSVSGFSEISEPVSSLFVFVSSPAGSVRHWLKPTIACRLIGSKAPASIKPCLADNRRGHRGNGRSYFARSNRWTPHSAPFHNAF